MRSERAGAREHAARSHRSFRCSRSVIRTGSGRAVRRALGGEWRVELGEEPALVAAPVAGQRVDAERELVAPAGELLDAAPAVAYERYGPRDVLGRVRPARVVAVDERERDRAPQVLAHARDEEERLAPVREHEPLAARGEGALPLVHVPVHREAVGRRPGSEVAPAAKVAPVDATVGADVAEEDAGREGELERAGPVDVLRIEVGVRDAGRQVDAEPDHHLVARAADDPHRPRLPGDQLVEIGRASCRERGGTWAVAVASTTEA